ncbi:hypothetical protein [Pedobacter antarcticus]|uniref:hypothetical protein n=1 Tax=Pedobacter antarcticus TaxID=34086 RepID=UPI001C59EAEB|nr:hypothetical protein [Pedobacter antarcticus]
MKEVKVPKRISWTSHIINLKIGEVIIADYSKVNTICSLISGRISLMYKKRKYITWKEEMAGQDGVHRKYLKIKREPDKNNIPVDDESANRSLKLIHLKTQNNI